MNQTNGSKSPRWIRSLVAVVGAVLVPLLGYAYLMAAHGDSTRPRWLLVSVPFAIIGPDYPPIGLFFVLLVLNVALWGTVLYWSTYLAQKALRRRHG